MRKSGVLLFIIIIIIIYSPINGLKNYILITIFTLFFCFFPALLKRILNFSLHSISDYLILFFFFLFISLGSIILYFGVWLGKGELA